MCIISVYIINVYMHYNALLTWVEIQDYMHINFKTCKTMLGISCILKKKVMEIINTQFGQGWGWRGRPQRKERQSCVCRVWLYTLGGEYVGVDMFFLSLSNSLKYMNTEWTKAERREAQGFTWHVEGEAAHGRGCLREVHLKILHLLKKRGQHLPNCLPSSDALGWGWAVRWKGQEQGRPCDTQRSQITEQGLRNQTLCVSVCM